MQLKGRVVGNHGVTAQTGGGQKAVDGPLGGIGMFRYGRKNATRYAPDIARLKVLGKHRRDDLVLGYEISPCPSITK